MYTTRVACFFDYSHKTPVDSVFDLQNKITKSIQRSRSLSFQKESDKRKVAKEN
jgi:hypothetical protein